MHLGPTRTDMVFLQEPKLSIHLPHPSMSAGPSHTLSVFHHSISKPDPRVAHLPPTPPSPPSSAGPGQSRLVLDGIPNMQLSDPPFAESGKQWRCGQARDCLGNKHGPGSFHSAPSHPAVRHNIPAFDLLHQAISISFLTNVIEPFCQTGSVWPFWRSRRPNWLRPFLLNPRSDKALSKEIIG